MGAAAAPQGTSRMGGIGKKELAAALGWTRPKLDRRLLSDRLFPVKKRGDQSGGWQFDLAAVKAYLAGGTVEAPQPAAAPPAIDQAQLRDAVAPPPARPVAPTTDAKARPSAHHEGEASARQRKEAAQAGREELKLAEAAKETVLKLEVVQIANLVFARLGNNLDALPDELARKLDLPEDAAVRIRSLIDDVRIAMAKDLEPLLGDG